MLPFTTAQGFPLFAAYNAAIWPAQIAAYALGIVALVLAMRSGASAGRIVTAMNPAACLFGAALLARKGCEPEKQRLQWLPELHSASAEARPHLNPCVSQ
jgi:hypothetical protein